MASATTRRIHTRSTGDDYISIFATLIVLTLTHGAGLVCRVGPFNIVVALLIATIKGTLVVLFFMHLRYSPS